MPSPAYCKSELGGAGEAGQASVLELVSLLPKVSQDWIWHFLVEENQIRFH